ncbi:aspartyl/glutamyl-tRNA amidotransferase subunit A (plasmid) [Antarctobacter heliothermus]|uniref:Aspartyl/glutamyl-tRNA amidotransferase subunit A n=1 Tax=Antarctobacter heliothermus TaxID=74033 RepID=A0A222EBU9_9RHOB|nr:amidase [Antarctobacter heliothermus]ASP23548.1 aspartyl/glutamyl-tRNA amidotransferase subunit A [Antarctobacter heliothermus]
MNKNVEPSVTIPADQLSVFSAAVDLAEALRAGTLSSRELLEDTFRQVDRLNPHLNAVVLQDREGARNRADAADAARVSGKPLGPLHGLPMTVKESFSVKGTVATWGRSDLSHNVATETAVAVGRMESAGAVLYGKSNVPLLLSDWQTYNAIYGTTLSPWDETRTPGGSSGGSAVALATGFSAVEMGSDIGASVRNPAHYCGIFGHKPSYGIVPLDGHLMPDVNIFPDISVAGPLARSARDLDVFLDVMAGPHGDSARGWRLSLPAPEKHRLSEFRVGLIWDSSVSEVDNPYQDLIRSFGEKLRAAGATVVDGAQPPFDERKHYEVYIRLLRAVTTARQPRDVFENALEIVPGLSEDDQSYAALLKRSTVMYHREWLAWHSRREAIRAGWAEWFGEYDLLLCPCAASTAFPLDETGTRDTRTIPINGHRVSYNDQLYWAGLASLSYLPASVAPIGFDSGGLPGGIQIIGRYLDDRTPIAFAQAIEREIGGYVPPPSALPGA